jgi:spermidine/putrescine transport system ATP-binding protein
MTESSIDNEGQFGTICLDIRNVVKRFPGITAVDHVSLQIRDGEIFSLLGPSGCGKSTLLRLVAGLESQDQGDIVIAGNVVNDLPPYKRDCSTVFQQHALFPHMTVFDNIGFGLVERRLSKVEIKKRVSEKIDLVNLVGLEDRYPHQLSGGQMQRVALARSLVLEPTVLLLDEPLAALDRKLRKEMQVELKRIQREVGTTFLNVTHDQKEALSLSDRIAVMRQGKFLQTGTPNQIYETPRTKFVAAFMGATNIFSGRVISKIGDKVELGIENGSKLFAPLPENFDVNSITGISVHPEVIDIAVDKAKKASIDPQKQTAFAGRIKEVVYQGDYSELTISLDLLKLNLSTFITRGSESDTGDVRKNQEVVVFWDSKYNNLLLADGSNSVFDAADQN